MRLRELCNPVESCRVEGGPVPKQRIQAYLDPETAQEIKRLAEDGHRPESWELERIIRLGLQASQREKGEAKS